MLPIKLIRLYYYVCACYNSQLRWQVQRFSPNSFTGQITDEELLTIYLFCVAYQEKYQLKSMHRYIREHWLDWFPTLGSYQTFVSRHNRLSDCLPLLVELLEEHLLKETGADSQVLLIDSLPIITCSAKRAGKVAPELTCKGFCNSKNLFYIGCKLHLLGARREQALPIPQHVGLTPANVHDLTALRPLLPELHQRWILADKAYTDAPLNQQLQEQGTTIITPVKQVKGKSQVLVNFDKAHDDLFSKAVSGIKQPRESFFSWLITKTNIQNAATVRSTKGLILHGYAKIAAALFVWILPLSLIRMYNISLYKCLLKRPKKDTEKDLVALGFLRYIHLSTNLKKHSIFLNFEISREDFTYSYLYDSG